MIYSWSSFQTCWNYNYLEQQICLFLCSWEFLISVAHDAFRNKGEGRKDKKIDDYIHGIVNVFLCNHQGVVQRRYGQNSLNISIILYLNPANHSWNMKWWHKQLVMVHYIVAMMIVAWFSIRCLHLMCLSISVFLRIFWLYPKWQSSIGRCRKSGNHPQEDVAKYGHKPQCF
jgi:hypothetical protein